MLGTVLLVLALAPAVAEAGWKIDRAKEIAAIVWNDPCPATVAWEEPSVAFARHPLPKMHLARAWSYPEQCRVALNADWERRFGYSWKDVCRSLIHEFGHLAGVEHSTNPRSVMSEYGLGTDPRCRERGRPYLARHQSSLLHVIR